MRVYIGFDDTDVLGAPIGTGRLVRMFGDDLPSWAKLWGVLRQQLLLDEAIPFTSHNSSACAVVEIDQPSRRAALRDLAARHIATYASDGSDPGLCMVADSDDLTPLIEFGQDCTHTIRRQDQALAAALAAGASLEGLGGTNDGIIGAAAAVGLTAWGWAGRFLEFNRLRDLPRPPTVGDIEAAGIRVMPLGNGVCRLPASTFVETKGWVSPRLWGGEAVLPLRRQDEIWQAVGKRPRDAEVAEG